MSFRKDMRDFGGPAESFNMTALIDIVFLLIIFFLVVCQFVDAENFEVQVPDDCENAISVVNETGNFVTVTVMADGYAVGGERIIFADEKQLQDTLELKIDEQLAEVTSDRRVVALRIDSEVPFSRAQYALAAIANSSATDIQLAVLKYKRNGD